MCVCVWEASAVWRGPHNNMLGYLRWDTRDMDDMFQRWSHEVRRGVDDAGYYVEQTWKPWDPILVESGEDDQLGRFKKITVSKYVAREEAQTGVGGGDGEGQVSADQRGI